MGIFGKGALCVSGCWGQPRRSSSQRLETEPDDKRARRFHRFKFLKLFRSSNSQSVYSPFLGVSFLEALINEGLLVPEPYEQPMLNICYGFPDDELLHYRRIRHRSYGRSRWDDVFATPGVLRVALEMDVNEPIVDELPVSLWLSCVEPILPALISLSQMQRRKTNLSKYRPSATPMPDPNENPTDHGDFDREPWFNVIGPQPGNNVHGFLPPTEEVRPTDMIENGLTEEKMRWYDLVTASRGRKHARSKCTRFAHSHSSLLGFTRVIQIRVNPPEMEDDAEEIGSYNSESESGDEGNYDLIQALFEE